MISRALLAPALVGLTLLLAWGAEGTPSPGLASPSVSTRRAAVLPRGLPLRTPVDVAMSGDRNLRVVHAPEGSTTALVYLHGMCGNPQGADLWADVASNYATVITVRADVKCPERPGFKWPQDVSLIQARIDAALEEVRIARGGLLRTDQVVLFGYSQGAHRAERLVAAFPQRYRLVALGGPPTSPTPERLRHARAIAVIGGEREDTTHMMDGYLALRDAGLNAEFFLLPRAGHGSYGPKGRAVIERTLDFLLRAPERAHP